jgi:hypothetical protein
MPDGAEHARLALHNMDVAAYLLEKPTFSDWAATVIFYSALHIVEIVLCSSKNPLGTKHCHDHGAREQILKRPIVQQGNWPHYPSRVLSRVLHVISRTARGKPLFSRRLVAGEFRGVFILDISAG